MGEGDSNVIEVISAPTGVTAFPSGSEVIIMPDPFDIASNIAPGVVPVRVRRGDTVSTDVVDITINTTVPPAELAQTIITPSEDAYVFVLPSGGSFSS